MLFDLALCLALLDTLLESASKHEHLVEKHWVYGRSLVIFQALADQVIHYSLVFRGCLVLEAFDEEQDSLKGVVGAAWRLSLAKDVQENREKLLCVEWENLLRDLLRLF